MKQRSGSSVRILDGERFTLIFGSAYICDGGHRRPNIRIVDRKYPNDSIRGYAPKTLTTIPLPHIRFRRCFRFRRIGGLVMYRAYHRAMRALCKVS